MLNYHFDKKLITTQRLLSELSMKISELDYWKFKWRELHYKKSKSPLPYEDWKKENDPCWYKGLRLIGNSALWDPIVFLNWLSENKLKNLPIELREQRLVAFVSRNSSEER